MSGELTSISPLWSRSWWVERQHLLRFDGSPIQRGRFKQELKFENHMELLVAIACLLQLVALVCGDYSTANVL
jgi:hypothetical protein